MEYIKVAETAAVLAGKMLRVQVSGKDILLANLDGVYYAINNRCTHMGGSLADGSLEGGSVRCPRHGACFDIKTGKALGAAKIAFVKMQVKDEETFPVRVDGSAILVGVS
jgi:3-phenylpropionate/trans-cinnamate dioxygenase ferredoxin component